MHLGGPSEETLRKKQAAYTIKSGVHRYLIALGNDGTALKPAIQFDERTKSNVGLPSEINMQFVRDTPFVDSDTLQKELVCEALHSSLYFYIKVNESKTVFKDCAKIGYVNYIPSVKPCEFCMVPDLKCVRRVVTVLTLDCEEGNKKCVVSFKRDVVNGSMCDYISNLWYICHTIVPETVGFTATNRVGAFPHIISIATGRAGWLLFLSYDAEKGTSKLYKAKLYSPVQVIELISGDIKGTRICYFNDRIRKHQEQLEKRYKENKWDTREINFGGEEKMSFTCLTHVDEELIFAACSSRKTIEELRIQRDGLGLIGVRSKLSKYPDKWKYICAVMVIKVNLTVLYDKGAVLIDLQ
eukprot:gene10575-19310_t